VPLPCTSGGFSVVFKNWPEPGETIVFRPDPVPPNGSETDRWATISLSSPFGRPTPNVLDSLHAASSAHIVHAQVKVFICPAIYVLPDYFFGFSPPQLHQEPTCGGRGTLVSYVNLENTLGGKKMTEVVTDKIQVSMATEGRGGRRNWD